MGDPRNPHGFERVGHIAQRLMVDLIERHIERVGLESRAVWCDGTRGHHQYERRLFQLIIESGKTSVVIVCGPCRKGIAQVPRDAVIRAGIDITDLPLLDDRRHLKCGHCNRLGAEVHHWAPRALFADADDWPVSPLCPDCHALWHRVTRTNRAQVA